MPVFSKSIFEHDYLIGDNFLEQEDNRVHSIPAADFKWLMELSCRIPEGTPKFLELTMRHKQHALQVKNYVGVLRTPSGFQLEILPKTGRSDNSPNIVGTRKMLLTMLRCLGPFRHLQTHNAALNAAQMPLLEVFIRQFLDSVNYLIKRGLRSNYIRRQENLSFQKGKLLMSQQLKHNLVLQHRFYVEFDEYLVDRPENRLIHSALKKVIGDSRSNTNQKLGQEFRFVFDSVPCSVDVKQDFQQVRLERGMQYYETPLAWARLILDGLSPLTSHGKNHSMSLLFPMEKVFEAYVAKNIRKHLGVEYSLIEQASSYSLVRHNGHDWFKLKPDLLIKSGNKNICVLDTKWKLLDSNKKDSKEKYGLSQADFYQLFAYGQKYLNGEGTLVLIYPQTREFPSAITNSFDFNNRLKLWVVPFPIPMNAALQNQPLPVEMPEYLRALWC